MKSNNGMVDEERIKWIVEKENYNNINNNKLWRNHKIAKWERVFCSQHFSRKSVQSDFICVT